MSHNAPDDTEAQVSDGTRQTKRRVVKESSSPQDGNVQIDSMYIVFPTFLLLLMNFVRQHRGYSHLCEPYSINT